MKKVLFLIYQLVGGGAEKVMVDIVNHMDKSKYDITVMTVIDCTKDKHILTNGIKYKYIFKDFLKFDRLFFKLMKSATPQFLHSLFIKEKYDVEIAALEGIPSKIISGCKYPDTKKIAIIHADASNIAWPSNRYKDFNQEYESYKSFDSLIFVSRNTQRKFLEKFKVDSRKTFVVYNPFDMDYIKNKSAELVDDYKKTCSILFCAIGRLEKVKGFDRLIEAFNVVQKQYNDIGLIIVGEGKDRDLIRKLIDKYNLNNKISLLGYRTNPYKYLRMSDCYICSSRSEGLSSTVIEAMILGVPIIATDCGGMDELLEDYKNGIIVDNDVSGLINGMKKFLSNLNDFRSSSDQLESNNLHRFSYDKYFDTIYKII
jgi:glycosyltransferase involved in cell wall biosynthesis